MNSVLNFPCRFERAVDLPASVEAVFPHLDDFERLGAHMMRGSWMMAGTSMHYGFDAARGRRVNSTVTITGSVLGVPLKIVEQVVERVPPRVKAWETTGPQRMLVLAGYRMGFELTPRHNGCRLLVFIEYALPFGGIERWLGRVVGPAYARWCVNRMIADAVERFASVTHSAEPTIGTVSHR